MKKRNFKQKINDIAQNVILWIKHFYGYETKSEKINNAPKSKIKRSYHSTKNHRKYNSYNQEYDDADDAATEEVLVTMSFLENDGNEN